MRIQKGFDHIVTAVQTGRGWNEKRVFYEFKRPKLRNIILHDYDKNTRETTWMRIQKGFDTIVIAVRTGRGSNEKREVMRFLTVAVTIRLSDSDLSRLEKPPYTQQKRDIFQTFHMCL